VPTDAVALARVLVEAAGLYLVAGALFAPWFVWRGAGRIDPHAGEATIGFRLVIVPGVIAFWPLLVARVSAGRNGPPVEYNAHRRAARHTPPGGGGRP
jgi:hypothetical protein